MTENKLHTRTFRHFSSSPADILEEISPYLPPEEAAMVDTFRNAMNIMEMMQMFQEYTDVSGGSSGEDSKDTSSDTDSRGRNPAMNLGGINPLDLMMGMLSPEQQEMFQMYQSMFSDIDSSNETDSDTQNQSPNNSEFKKE